MSAHLDTLLDHQRIRECAKWDAAQRRYDNAAPPELPEDLEEIDSCLADAEAEVSAARAQLWERVVDHERVTAAIDEAIERLQAAKGL